MQSATGTAYPGNPRTTNVYVLAEMITKCTCETKGEILSRAVGTILAYQNPPFNNETHGKLMPMQGVVHFGLGRYVL